jgi:hypothetical protein
MSKTIWEKELRERSEWWKEMERKGGKGLSGVSRSVLIEQLRKIERDNIELRNLAIKLTDELEKLRGNNV